MLPKLQEILKKPRSRGARLEQDLRRWRALDLKKMTSAQLAQFSADITEETLAICGAAEDRQDRLLATTYINLAGMRVRRR